MQAPAILVIEDNPITRKMVRVTLESEGYKVQEASDGRTALQAMTNAPPDLVLQDLILPDMDGFELIQKLRSSSSVEIPILAYSGLLSKMEQARSLQLGFTDFLFKPVEPSRLLEMVRKYLPQASPDMSRPGGGRHILVVNDDAVQRRLVQAHLEALGFNVSAAGDGVSAFEQARRAPPAAIISDVLMPQLDGFRLARAVRLHRELAHVPVVLVSAAYTEESDRQTAEAAGASAFLQGSPSCHEIGESLLEVLRKPPPPAPPQRPIELSEEYTYRIIRQLEHQAALNASVTQRLAVREAELAVLTGLTETLRKTPQVENVLDALLYRCVEVTGLSRGAAYLHRPDGSLQLRAHLGFPPAALARLPEFFGHESLLQYAIARGEVLEIPSREAPYSDFADLLERVEAKALLIVPLAAAEDRFGAFVMASQSRQLGDNWLTFAQAVGGQIAQAIRLARAMSLLRESEEKLGRIVATIADGLLISDHRGVFTFANAAAERILGTPAAEIIGRGCADSEWKMTAIEGEKLLPQPHPCMRVLRTGQPEHGAELAFPHPDRGRLILSINAAPLRDAAGNIIGAVASVRDITARKRAEQALVEQAKKLAHSNAELEKFAYVASHDLQEPLRTVASYLQLLQSRYKSRLDADADKFIGFAVQGAHRMRQLIHDLLAYSRLSRSEATFETTNCEAVFQQSLANLGGAIEESRGLVTSDPLPVLTAERAQLTQLFQNLIGNALKFHGSEPPRIHISSEKQGGEWIFAVRDNGIGIDPQYRERIFEVFQRLHGKHEYPGTGIGLALCKQIVERHGGRIWVESEPGHGSTFYFSLPEQTGTPTTT